MTARGHWLPLVEGPHQGPRCESGEEPDLAGEMGLVGIARVVRELGEGQVWPFQREMPGALQPGGPKTGRRAVSHQGRETPPELAFGDPYLLAHIDETGLVVPYPARGEIEGSVSIRRRPQALGDDGRE